MPESSSVLMLVATLISFFATQAVVTEHHIQHGISYPGALRVVIGNVLFLTVLGIMCAGLGGWVRNSAGGIAVFVGLIFVLSGIIDILPSDIGNAVMPYLPLNAGTGVATYIFGQLPPPHAVGRVRTVLRIHAGRPDRRVVDPRAPRRLTSCDEPARVSTPSPMMTGSARRRTGSAMGE